MTSDFGGIRHPKYKVKNEDERVLMTKNFGGINQPLYPVLNPGAKKGAISNSKGFHAPSRERQRAKTFKNLSPEKKRSAFRSSKGAKSMLNLPREDNIGGYNQELAMEDTGNAFNNMRASQHSYRSSDTSS
jgi:hypothetical protein